MLIDFSFSRASARLVWKFFSENFHNSILECHIVISERTWLSLWNKVEKLLHLGDKIHGEESKWNNCIFNIQREIINFFRMATTASFYNSNGSGRFNASKFHFPVFHFYHIPVIQIYIENGWGRIKYQTVSTQLVRLVRKPKKKVFWKT